MSNPQNVPQVWEIIEAANEGGECHIRFSLQNRLGIFFAAHEGPYVQCQTYAGSFESKNQELADIIRAKCKEVMRESEHKISTPGNSVAE
jgi:hypothetical protein